MTQKTAEKIAAESAEVVFKVFISLVMTMLFYHEAHEGHEEFISEVSACSVVKEKLFEVFVEKTGKVVKNLCGSPWVFSLQFSA